MIYFLFFKLFISFFILRSYLGITIHWLEPATLEKKQALHVVDCKENIHITYLWKQLKTLEYQILDKILHIIIDNVTNFAKAFKYVNYFTQFNITTNSKNFYF